jgi:hypothetical protein
MTHSEKCPVCDGLGQYEPKRGNPGDPCENSRECHGCNGRGWIVIGYESMPYIPQPYYPIYLPNYTIPQPQWPEIIPYYEPTWKAGANEFLWGNITVSGTYSQ